MEIETVTDFQASFRRMQSIAAAIRPHDPASLSELPLKVRAAIIVGMMSRAETAKEDLANAIVMHLDSHR